MSSSLYASRLSGRQIRLLEISATTEAESPLECNLHQTSLEDTPNYYALSYVWGDSTDREPIRCGGQSISVTTNLYSILHQYRARATRVHVWVDALCINQSDDEEKTCQVQMMRDIYKQAEKVIIWLGELQDTDETAIQGLALVNAPWATYDGIPLFQGMDPALYDTWLAENLPNETLVAISAFLRRPWFQRIWIVQELLSARVFELWLGPRILDPDVVLYAAARILEFSSVNTRLQLATPDDANGPLSKMQLTCAGRLQALKEYSKGNRLEIHGLVRATRGFKSTDPRDTLYALAGLDSGVDKEFVDYSVNFRTATINLTRRFLEGKLRMDVCPLDVLSDIYMSSLGDCRPSWAVDWTSLSESLYTPLAPGYPSKNQFMQGDAVIRITDDHILYVRGTVIDYVKETIPSPKSIQHPVSKAELLQASHRSEIIEWHSRCSEISQKLPNHPSGEPNDEVFWRTLVCNRPHVGSTKAADSSTMQSYHAWLRFLQGEPQFQAPARIFEYSFSKWSQGRQLCITKDNQMAWIPAVGNFGDCFVLFSGCRIPFVLREYRDGYKLLGDCYRHGHMDGVTEDMPSTEVDFKIY